MRLSRKSQKEDHPLPWLSHRPDASPLRCPGLLTHICPGLRRGHLTQGAHPDLEADDFAASDPAAPLLLATCSFLGSGALLRAHPAVLCHFSVHVSSTVTGSPRSLLLLVLPPLPACIRSVLHLSPSTQQSPENHDHENTPSTYTSS